MKLEQLEDFYLHDGTIFTPPPPSKKDGEPLVLASLRGRLCEFSSDGVQGVGSLAARYVWEAQQAGCWPVWVSQAGLPFAEDMQACGIDLRALPMIRTQRTAESLRAAERVMRSCVCGIVVIDLGAEEYVPAAMMGRMMKLAQRTNTACVLLSTRSRGGNASLSPLVSLRVSVTQHPDIQREMSVGHASNMRVRVQIVRDKKERRQDGFSIVSAASPGAL